MMQALLRFTAIALAVPALGLPADEDFSRYLHPDAKFLMGIEMRHIATSAVASTVRKQFTDPAKLSGFDPLKDVSRILISSPGQRKGTEDDKGAMSEAPFLMVIIGKFDLQKLKEIATADGEVVARYGSVELIAPPHGKTASMHFGLVSPTLLLAGDAISMREAIDRRMLPAGSVISPALLRRAAALAASTDVWMTSTISPAELGAARAPGLAMFSEVRGMDMTMSLQHGLGVHLTLNTRTRAAAGKLAGAITAFTQLASAQATEELDLLKNVSVKNDGAAVTMSLVVDSATLEKGIAQIQQSVEPKAAARKQPEPAPQRRVIRIVGAESGPAEIPFDPPSP